MAKISSFSGSCILRIGFAVNHRPFAFFWCRQRAFLALALAQNPQVLLLDEPTTYLDICYHRQLLEVLKKLNIKQN